MRRFAYFQLLIIGLLCQAAAANSELDSKIRETSSRINTTAAEQLQLLNSGTKINAEIDEKEKEKKALEKKISQWALTTKKLTILSSEGDKKAAADLNQIQFEVKRAQFTIGKLNEAIAQLKKDQDTNRKQKRILKSQADELVAELERLKNQKAEKATTAIAEARPAAEPVPREPAREVPQPVQTAAPPDKEQAAIRKQQEEQAARTAMIKQHEKEQEQIAINQARAAEAAQRAEQEKLRLAEQEKQRLAEQEKLRLAEQEKQRLAEQEKQRLAEQEKQRLAEQEKQRQAEQEVRFTESTSGSIQDQVRKKFISSSNSLPPAESALTLAMARALDSSATQQPLLSGDQLTLKVANPAGSTPQTIGTLKHLGNNQYMLETRISKGKQTFILGEYQFHKNIPEHFDNIRCLILIDARNAKDPVFEMVVAGG